MTSALEWTGERYVPWLRGAGADIHYEHLQRYLFAQQFVRGKRVVDLGSGEGYGAFLLARDATSVVGVDIDAAAISHARSRYSHLRPNLSFTEGSITAVPLDGRSFDIVVCFETLEHVTDHDALLAEAARLLAPDGVFVVSTPNKLAYSDRPGYRNPFHQRELYFHEFDSLLRQQFRRVAILGQRVFPTAFIWALDERSRGEHAELLITRTTAQFRVEDRDAKDPMYFLAVASTHELPGSVATEHRVLDLSAAYAEELLQLHAEPRLTALERELEALREDNERSRREQHDTATCNAELHSRVQQLSDDLRLRETDTQRLAADVIERDEQIAQLTDGMAQRCSQFAAASQQREDAAVRIRELDARVERLADALRVREADAERLSADMLLREEESKRLEKVIALQNEELAASSQEKLNLRATLDASEHARILLSGEHAILRQQLVDEQRRHSLLRTERDNLRSEIADLQSIRVTLSTENERLGHTLRNTESARELLSGTHDTLRRGLLEATDALRARGDELLTLSAAHRRVDAAFEALQSSRSSKLAAKLRAVAGRLRRLRRESPPLLTVDEPPLRGEGLAGTIAVRGWAAGSRSVRSVELLCDEQVVAVGRVGLPREDVAAHLAWKSASHSGFELVWDTKGIRIGPHRVIVRATDDAGRLAEVSGSVEILPALCLQLDEPSGEALSRTGELTLWGWAAGPFRVVLVEARSGDEVLAVGRTGLPRPDVAATHGHFADAANSGYTLRLPPLRPHHKEVVVRAVDVRGRESRVTRIVAPLRVVSASPAPVRTQAGCRRFAVYAASAGNYFFGEIRDLVAAGLEELGFEVQRRDERGGFACDADWHLVVAPHEFFHLGAGPALVERTPPQLVLVTTEQPGSPWFALAAASFPRAHAIWDMHPDCAQQIARGGYRSSHITLGFCARHAAATPPLELPLNYGTNFLEPNVRGAAGATERFGARPIDLLFVGHASERRKRIVARMAPVLARYRCYLHLASHDGPVIPGATTHMDTATVVGLARRSKVVLNIHRTDEQYFEWHRMVMQGIWQRALVVTESSTAAAPFAPGIDYLEAPAERLAAMIDDVLATSAGVERAAAIADHGYRTLTEKCQLTDSLRQCLLDLFDVPPVPSLRGQFGAVACAVMAVDQPQGR